MYLTTTTNVTDTNMTVTADDAGEFEPAVAQSQSSSTSLSVGVIGSLLTTLLTFLIITERHLAMIGGAVCLSVLLSVTSWYHVKTNSSWYRAVFASRYKGGKGSGFIKRLYCSTSHSRRSGTDHTVLPANYTVYLPLPRKQSPDGASPD